MIEFVSRQKGVYMRVAFFAYNETEKHLQSIETNINDITLLTVAAETALKIDRKPQAIITTIDGQKDIFFTTIKEFINEL